MNSDLPTTEKIRHSHQSELLIQAVGGNALAMNQVLEYLSSANPCLCRIMQEAIHDLCEFAILQNLLYCFAMHRWNNRLDCDRRSDPLASERIDLSIIEVFTLDKNKAEIPVKETLLHQSMKDSQPRIKRAAAYIAGIRGDQEAIPILGEIIESGTKDWQLRAIKALAFLGNERCIPPLINALTSDNGLLHREARRALQSMGCRAEPAWVELLQHSDSHIRWEASRGLGEIGNAKAALILAEGLFDENYAVRWATADVLANLGESAVPATLTLLSRYPLDEKPRQAAYHALHGISNRTIQERIKSLIDALRDPAASVNVPVVAQRLLIEWGRS